MAGATVEPRWGSDVIVRLLTALGIEHVALVAGASFRGLHESLVATGAPGIITCIHENVAVALAHGYVKVTGRPMAVALHNIVGLQAGSMSIYNAWCDQVPVLVLGGTGPMDSERRRRTEWIHTALVQGTLVRDYVKWDDQPAHLDAVPHSLLRAYRVATTEPCGPVYVCLDVALQEEELETVPEPPAVARYAAAAPIAPNPRAVEQAADLLSRAQRPVILADRAGRHAESFSQLERLSELLGAAMVDGYGALNFRTDHPHNLTGARAEVLAEADVVLAVDMQNLGSALGDADGRPLPGPLRARIISSSLNELRQRSWAGDEGLVPVDVPLLSDSRLTLPALAGACAARLAGDEARAGEIAVRRERLAARHRELRARWSEVRRRRWDDRPISMARWTAELWDVVRHHDWVVVCGPVMTWAAGCWEITDPTRYLGGRGGAGQGYAPGAAVGAALALKGSGRLPIALIGDGELLMASSALWTAVHHRLPLLVVVHDNRCFGNDAQHQQRIAARRGRPADANGEGVRLDDPAVDLGGLARAYGADGQGPIEDPGQLHAAFSRAVDVVARGGVALVDVVAEAGSFVGPRFPAS